MSAESNARDRAYRSVNRINNIWNAGHDRMVERFPDRELRPPPYIDWNAIKETKAENDDLSWEDIADTLYERRLVEDAYLRGDSSLGKSFYENRDDRFPEEMYYYHGAFA